jgi:hypothetical protein
MSVAQYGSSTWDGAESNFTQYLLLKLQDPPALDFLASSWQRCGSFVCNSRFWLFQQIRQELDETSSGPLQLR